MAEVFERKDIKLGPAYPWMMFGDGYMAQATSILAVKNIKGEEIWKVTLIPTEELAKRHNITLDLLDDNLALETNYPLEAISQLSNDPAFTVYFNFLNFLGQECPGTKFWKGFVDSKRIESLKKIINLLRGENAFLTEQLEKAKNNISQYIKEYIMGPAGELNAQFFAQFQQNQSGSIRQNL